MIDTKSILVALMLLSSLMMGAQETDRDHIRLGNRHYKATQFHEAETNYLKAIEKNPSFEAYYNLANAFLLQGQDSVAFENYKKALQQPCNNVLKKAMAYHNMGDMQYLGGLSLMKTGGNATEAFQQAVELFKSSLRCNPDDNGTRYNLAMAQYMLKQSQQNQQNQQQQQDQQDEKDEKQKKDEQQQQQNQNKEEKQQQQQENSMSEEAMQQLLNSAQQDEKAVQKKVKEQKSQPQRRQLQKDW